MADALHLFLNYFKESFKNHSFVKLQLTHYSGEDIDLQKIIIKPVIIKRKEQVSFVYRYKTRDITKNIDIELGLNKLTELIDYQNFKKAYLATTNKDYNLKVKMNSTKLNSSKPILIDRPTLLHDNQKQRKINTNNKYLHLLNITDKDGKVYKSTQSKYRQINHYIEILSGLLKKLPSRPMTNIVDMGAGKGYLTFALFDYLNHELKIPSKVVGVEFRKNLVNLCNEVAQQSDFQNLQFQEGTIEQYQANFDIHVLIALHACDTATDEALYQGISAKADLIVVAPCCHNQIRKEIKRSKQKNELDFLLKHGIFLERQAEMVTDGIRALILEYHGYSTKVFEFISDAHTPKNVLIVGERKENRVVDQAAILEKIQKTKAYFGIERHHLEGLLKL